VSGIVVFYSVVDVCEQLVDFLLEFVAVFAHSADEALEVFGELGEVGVVFVGGFDQGGGEGFGLLLLGGIGLGQ
jgi:hypothetical protein